MAIAMPKTILSHFLTEISKTISNGKSVAKNIPKLPTNPIVLNPALLAKLNGKNNPNSWKTPKSPVNKLETAKIITDEIISFFEKTLLIKK